MLALNKTTLLSILLLSGCTLGDHLENRYTKEIPVSAHLRASDVCFSLPLRPDEIVVSAMTYNREKPVHQRIFPASKQPQSGLFCIQPTEFKFAVGQNYFTYIEVNTKTDGENRKLTRRAFVSAFQVIQRDNQLTIIESEQK